MNPHARDAEMLQHIKAWQASGETQANYCERHRITIHQFIYYKQKLGFMKPRRKKSNAQKQLLPVTIKPETESKQPLWIEHQNGFKVEFTEHSNIEKLSRVLSIIKTIT